MTRVAIQGVTGSYSEEAARRLLGEELAIVECTDFDETFEALRAGRAEKAVVPIENKIVGAIKEPNALLQAGDFRIIGIVPLAVRHVLAGSPDSTFERLTSVWSHVEALKQCSRFLAKHAHLTQMIGADTASSIQRIVADANPANAAICSQRAAKIYGARILREDIADDIDNWTTFYLIAN
jgi:chorismate mutase/prephenate dehydratase